MKLAWNGVVVLSWRALSAFNIRENAFLFHKLRGLSYFFLPPSFLLSWYSFRREVDWYHKIFLSLRSTLCPLFTHVPRGKSISSNFHMFWDFSYFSRGRSLQHCERHVTSVLRNIVHRTTLIFTANSTVNCRESADNSTRCRHDRTEKVSWRFEILFRCQNWLYHWIWLCT